MIGEEIVSWYEREGRRLPWRDTTDPYRIWLAEVIMQQTRIETGVAYFERLLERFPTLPDLAIASLDEVLKYWEGLGYYSRARNLHAAARQLIGDYGGVFPGHHHELQNLKGVGPYTARAIASFAFGRQVAVLDGNVMRVVSRLMGDFSPIDQQKTRNKFQAQLDEWVSTVDSRKFNHGMMDLGATICTPSKPACLVCPLSTNCVARREGTTHLLPQKGKKLKRATRYFQFVLVTHNEQLMIRQRPEKGLWGGLWEIPNREVDQQIWQAKRGPEGAEYLGANKHVFTHFDMEYQVFRFVGEILPDWVSGSFEKYENLPTFAFSRAVLNMFAAHLPSYRQMLD